MVEGSAQPSVRSAWERRALVLGVVALLVAPAAAFGLWQAGVDLRLGEPAPTQTIATARTAGVPLCPGGCEPWVAPGAGLAVSSTAIPPGHLILAAVSNAWIVELTANGTRVLSRIPEPCYATATYYPGSGSLAFITCQERNSSAIQEFNWQSRHLVGNLTLPAPSRCGDPIAVDLALGMLYCSSDASHVVVVSLANSSPPRNVTVASQAVAWWGREITYDAPTDTILSAANGTLEQLRPSDLSVVNSLHFPNSTVISLVPSPRGGSTLAVAAATTSDDLGWVNGSLWVLRTPNGSELYGAPTLFPGIAPFQIGGYAGVGYVDPANDVLVLTQTWGQALFLNLGSGAVTTFGFAMGISSRLVYSSNPGVLSAVGGDPPSGYVVTYDYNVTFGNTSSVPFALYPTPGLLFPALVGVVLASTGAGTTLAVELRRGRRVRAEEWEALKARWGWRSPEDPDGRGDFLLGRIPPR